MSNKKKYAIHVKQTTMAVRFVEADSEQEALDSYNAKEGAPDLGDIEYDMDFLCEDEEFIRIEEIEEEPSNKLVEPRFVRSVT